MNLAPLLRKKPGYYRLCEASQSPMRIDQESFRQCLGEAVLSICLVPDGLLASGDHWRHYVKVTTVNKAPNHKHKPLKKAVTGITDLR